MFQITKCRPTKGDTRGGGAEFHLILLFNSIWGHSFFIFLSGWALIVGINVSDGLGISVGIFEMQNMIFYGW